MQFSKAAQNYPPSGIRKMFDLAAKYPDAIKLTVGEPNFDTPAYIKEAAKKAMDAGETHYTPNAACVKKMAQMNEAIASCVSSFPQVAAAEALKSTECVEQMVADYTRRRDILIDGINAIPGFSCRKSAGSFYAFANIKAFGKSSQEFAEELLTGAGVVAVPGSAFGACGEGYLRLVFTNSDENLKEAVRRIDTYVRKTYPDMK